MKTIKFELRPKIEWDEFKKAIGFVSEEIEDYHFESGKLFLRISDESKAIEVLADLADIANKYVSEHELEKQEFYNQVEVKKYQHDFQSINYFDSGMMSLSNQSLFLYNYFDCILEEIIKEIFDNEKNYFEKKLYPVLLPVNSYKKTGYLKRTPQYAIFCCSAMENLKMLSNLDELDFSNYKAVINEPKYALSPSACFHVYEEYKNRVLEKNTVITFTQSVFRNEGRFNFSQFGRMRDYHVREIVFIGDSEFVETSRNSILCAIKLWVKEIGLNAKIMTASDPFILPKMQKYKKLQKIDRSKYELQVSYDNDEYMSVASFNLHGDAFSTPFNIKVEEKDTVTGCVGFGLERFVLSFLSQYGEESCNWPEKIKKEYKEIQNVN